MNEPRAALRRADLAGRTRAVLHRGGARNPDVLLVATDDGLVVVKDFAPRGAAMRRLFGPWLQRREIRAYQALADHPSVPRFLGRVDSLAFAVEYRPGQRMSRRLAGTLPDGFIDRLADAVGAMHARGVVHLDLRHRSNVLVDECGNPVLIDFGSALVLAPHGALARWLGRLDWNAVEKWRQRLATTSTGVGASASDSSGDRRGASRPT